LSGDDKVKVSGKILPGSVRVSVMAEGQRPRKTKRKREKATPVNAEIQAAVEKERHAQSIARAKRNIEDIAQCNQWDWFATFTVAPDCRELAKYPSRWGTAAAMWWYLTIYIRRYLP
jgi:hypothetical protein